MEQWSTDGKVIHHRRQMSGTASGGTAEDATDSNFQTIDSYNQKATETIVIVSVASFPIF